MEVEHGQRAPSHGERGGAHALRVRHHDVAAQGRLHAALCLPGRAEGALRDRLRWIPVRQ